jgi:hypothetical protein
VLTFNVPVVGGTAIVTGHNPGSGTGTAGTPSFSGNEMIIPLSGVSNGQVLKITVAGATDGTNTLPSFDVNVGFLIGDTTSNGHVNSSDISQTQAETGHVTTSSNFREDVVANGMVNSTDIQDVQAHSGTALP